MFKKYIFILLTTTSLTNAEPTDNKPNILARFQNFYNNNQNNFTGKNVAIGALAVGTTGLMLTSIARKICYGFIVVGIGTGAYAYSQGNDELKKYLPSTDQVTNLFHSLANVDWSNKINKFKELLFN